jgi:DNA-binding CsgD family transcriptional regulator
MEIPLHELDQVTSTIYDSVLVPVNWTAALKRICGFTGSEAAEIIVWDRRCDRVHVSESFGASPEAVAEYENYYHQLDPQRPLADRIPTGQWYLDRRDFGQFAIKHSEFYQDYLNRIGWGSVMSNRLLRVDGIDGYFSMQRAVNRPYYDDADIRKLEPLASHLQRALRIRLKLQAASLKADVAGSVLDNIRLPMMVLDEAGCVFMANAGAESLLRTKPALSVRHGRLVLNPGSQCKLLNLLHAACGLSGAAVAGGFELMEAERRILRLIVIPLPPQVNVLNRDYRPLALLVVQRDEREMSSAEYLLRNTYRLTLAEARVATYLLSGMTPSQAAQKLRVSIPTVRSQISVVLKKTGATRQSDLVRLLSWVLFIEGREASG